MERGDQMLFFNKKKLYFSQIFEKIKIKLGILLLLFIGIQFSDF
jgi:hypothetical protein